MKYSLEFNRRIGGVRATLLVIGAFLPTLFLVRIALLVIYDERAIQRHRSKLRD